MQIYDPMYGLVQVPELLTPIVNSPWFRRLQHLRQLGVCYLSFPGGNHTRFEHSLGAFNLSTRVALLAHHAADLARADRERLAWLLQLGSLCHDIGHGPYSHMTENVLLGLGAKLTHEEIGAAVVTHYLKNELGPFVKWDISPELIGMVITKTPTHDDLVQCAMTLVSSDIDVDRIDYLHRDSYYSGINRTGLSLDVDLQQVWELRRTRNSTRFELTEKGISFAEHILFKRRNNYRDIVFETRHMAATGMFEKAIWLAVNAESEFGRRAKKLTSIQFDWRDTAAVSKYFNSAWELYGLVDYEAIEMLDTASNEAHYLVEKIRRGVFFQSVGRYRWTEIHYLSKQSILALKDDHQIFSVRRKLESALAWSARVNPLHIVCHLVRFPATKQLMMGTVDRQLLEERSALGAFLVSDTSHNYYAEVFVDSAVDSTTRGILKEKSKEIFLDGSLPEIIAQKEIP